MSFKAHREKNAIRRLNSSQVVVARRETKTEGAHGLAAKIVRIGPDLESIARKKPRLRTIKRKRGYGGTGLRERPVRRA